MSSSLNRQWLLSKRPKGMLGAEHFTWTQMPVPQPGDGEVLVRNEWLSLDPYMRGRMNEAKFYAPSVAIG